MLGLGNLKATATDPWSQPQFPKILVAAGKNTKFGNSTSNKERKKIAYWGAKLIK